MQLLICGFEIEERIESDSEGLEQGEYANSSVKRNGGISLGGTWGGRSYEFCWDKLKTV